MGEFVEDLDGLESEEERSALVTFLDALYIPKLRFPISLSASRRSKAGNRSNDVMVGWDTAEGDQKSALVRRWIEFHERQTEKLSAFGMNVVVVTAVLMLLVMAGLAAQRKVLRPSRPSVAGAYSVAKQRSGAGAAKKATPVIVAPAVRRDERGQPVEIRASDPRSVLYGFCSVRAGSLCEPVELAWTEPRHPEIRIGVFRAFYDLRAIRIRRDRVTGQWVAGNGLSPVHDSVVQGMRLSSARTPI